MSIYRARLRNISNALTLRMSGEQIRSLQVPRKLFEVNSWIPQMIRSRLPLSDPDYASIRISTVKC